MPYIVVFLVSILDIMWRVSTNDTHIHTHPQNMHTQMHTHTKTHTLSLSLFFSRSLARSRALSGSTPPEAAKALTELREACEGGTDLAQFPCNWIFIFNAIEVIFHLQQPLPTLQARVGACINQSRWTIAQTLRIFHENFGSFEKPTCEDKSQAQRQSV